MRLYHFHKAAFLCWRSFSASKQVMWSKLMLGIRQFWSRDLFDARIESSIIAELSWALAFSITFDAQIERQHENTA